MASFLRTCRRLLGAALLVPFCLVAPSCSEDPSVPVPEVDEALFLQELTAAICERRQGCGCASVTSGATPCETTVRERLLEVFPLQKETPLSFDGACAALLLDAFGKTSGCTASFYPFYEAFRCEVGCSIFHGAVREGNPCSTPEPGNPASSCEGSLSCIGQLQTPTDFAQVCRDACPSPAGGPCGYDPSTGTSRGCGVGGVCMCPNDNPSSCTCKAAPEPGASCAQGLCDPRRGYCETASPQQPPPTDFTPTCRALKPDGAGCNAFAQCQSGFCPDGACRARPGAGAPCAGGLCGAGFTCQDGTCKPVPGALCSF
jgi:hypothetical protein